MQQHHNEKPKMLQLHPKPTQFNKSNPKIR